MCLVFSNAFSMTSAVSQSSLPIHMEDHFSPGFKTKPAVHIGSQTMRLYDGDEWEQAIEGLHLAGASDGDVVVVRNIDPEYVEYWKELMGNVHVINLQTENKLDYLSNLILDDQTVIDEIKSRMAPSSKMMVYFPTKLEAQVAQSLGVKLHGSPSHSDEYGTKVGIRKLAQDANLSMPEGYICRDIKSIEKAVRTIFSKYETLIIKHTLSSAGRWMKKITRSETIDIPALVDEISGGKFTEGKDEFVVEAWVKNTVSLCIHIEILEDEEPKLLSAWQQIIDTDGISYLGAGPLMLTSSEMDSFLMEAKKLARALQKNGAIGSFGPDFIITSDEEKNYQPGTALLIELNARVPFTAFPLEIIQQVKGKIGTGFLSLNIDLPSQLSFHEVKMRLKKKNLLIEKKSKNAVGIVPFNIAMLKWKKLYFVAMANNWSEVQDITFQVKELFAS